MLDTALRTQDVPSIRPTTCSDLIVDYIRQLNIDVVFGVPGGAIEPLFNALARSERRDGPKLVVARHECGAAFMADGYYRETGKMGVVCATTGPGATNLITGISSAMAEHTPMLVITAQTALPKFGHGALQESSCTAIDTVAMMRHCTGFTTLVSHPQQLESKLISAIMAAHRNPACPVHISVPSDVLSMALEMPQRIHADLFSHDFRIADDRAIEVLCRKVNKVDTIVVYLDQGAKSAAQQVVRFCELVNAPFVTSQTGKYWVDERHPLYRGVYGFAGHKSARDVFEAGQVDLILAVGAALDELSTGGWDPSLLNTKLVHIDNNLEHFTRSPMANHHVCGDAGAIFEKLNRFVDRRRTEGKSWWTCSPRPRKKNSVGSFATLDGAIDGKLSDSPVKPQQLIFALNKALPDTARIYMDAGNVWAWMTHYFVNKNYNGNVRAGMAFGSMGWSVGAAIGSAYANRQNITVCIVGDGAYLMSAQELSVAAQLKLPVLFVVLNDAALGMVMHGQRIGRAESIGWPIGPVNFAQQAQSLGVAGVVVKSARQVFEMDMEGLLLSQGPLLLDVRLDREEVPPILQRVQGLGSQQ